MSTMTLQRPSVAPSRARISVIRPEVVRPDVSRAGGTRSDGTPAGVAPTSSSPRLRITRRGRAVLAVLIAIPLSVGAVAFGLGQGAAAQGSATQGSATQGSATQGAATPGERAQGAAAQGANAPVSSTADGSSASAHGFRYITVRSGESLWSIAQRVAPGSDPRDVIADIVDLNQLPSASVDAGERLAVPTRYAG